MSYFIFHIYGVHLAFWITLLSMIISRSIHVVANGILSFLWLILYCIYAQLYPFICWSTFSLLWLLWIVLLCTEGYMYLFELEFCPDGFHVLDLPFSHFPVASWCTELFQVIALHCVCAPLLSSVLLFSASVHGISQARTLEWVAVSSSSGGFSWARMRTCIFCTGRRILYHWATRKPCISLPHR